MKNIRIFKNIINVILFTLLIPVFAGFQPTSKTSIPSAAACPVKTLQQDLAESGSAFRNFFETNGNIGFKAYEATIEKSQAFRTNVPILNKLTELVTPNIINKLPGGKTDLQKIVKVIVHPCCGNSHEYLKDAVEHLDDVKHFIDEFSQTDGFTTFLGALKNPEFFAQDGASFMLTKLKTLTNADVAKIDGQILDADNLAGICGTCRLDIELKNPTVKIELKSYKGTTIQNIPSSGRFINQFKAYLADADNFDEFQYIFNGAKEGANVGAIKQSFQKVFQKGNYQIYSDIMTANPQSTLFSSIGIGSKAVFKQRVDNLDPALFGFIDIL